MNKAILVGVGVGIALIVIVGISAVLVTQENQSVSNELTLEDKVDVEIKKATEETLEPTGGTKYNFTAEGGLGLTTP